MTGNGNGVALGPDGKAVAETLRFALRFDRRHARPLRQCFEALTERSRQEPAIVKLFQYSIDAAETGDPLILTANSVEEIIAISQQFAAWGVRPAPTFDVLDG